MRPSAKRLLRGAVCATAVVVVPLVTATRGEARHVNKHHSWAAAEARPMARSWSGGGDVCPGSARSFDCRIWPPPFDDDSDRKSGDGGGG